MRHDPRYLDADTICVDDNEPLPASVTAAWACSTGDPKIVCEEICINETQWIALRCRGNQYSWLTMDEAMAIGRFWLDRYGRKQ